VILHTSSGLSKIPHLDILLEQPISRYRFWGSVDRAVAVIGWGTKRYARRADRLAKRLKLPFICLEDGFLRSVGLGNQDPPLSIVVDQTGIYYDASRPSKLETLIAHTDLSDEQRQRAQDLIQAWRAARVSKYNHQRDYVGELPPRYVLAIDQTFGDASIAMGQANADSFRKMLDAALIENPDCTVILKIHPDVFSGKRKGHFNPSALHGNPRVQVLTQDVHPASLLAQAEAVYAVTSQMGFEGLLWGKRVRTFGMPFYAGWGLTEDDLAPPDRRKPASIESLVHAALIIYPRYLDPETGARCEAERVIEWMSFQRRMRERFPREMHAVGFSSWKWPIVRDFFSGSSIRFVEKGGDIAPSANAIVWGMKDAFDPNHRAPSAAGLVRVEDGFLRSVGLGADLIRPLSWVIDGRGIYYDSTRPSDLEHLLLTSDFDAALIARAAHLRQSIRSSGLTKYNVGAGTWQRPSNATRVILVPGQVETDASLAFGAPAVRRNIDLLRAVRTANPGAYVIYKPHPDVVAGLRMQGQDENAACHWCDEIVIDLPMGKLLDVVDEVHVLTSLAGFEALLRGRHVETHGQPFYAGWGLTVDHCPIPRRTRKLMLNELIAGVLILYPTYVSRSSGRFTTPERALEELLVWREAGVAEAGLLLRLKRSLLRRIVGVR
jgi:capsular polysaccharide export protein